MYGVCMETCNKSRTIASRRSLEGQYLAISLRLLGVLFPDKCIAFQLRDFCHAVSRRWLHMKVFFFFFLTHRMNVTMALNFWFANK